MEKEQRERLIEKLNGLALDIDFENVDYDSVEDFDSLTEAIEDAELFNVEIIYYGRAMDYLSKEDPSLIDSMGIAADIGYSPHHINSELLASLLASQQLREEWEELREDVEKIFESIQEEE